MYYVVRYIFVRTSYKTYTYIPSTYVDSSNEKTVRDETKFHDSGTPGIRRTEVSNEALVRNVMHSNARVERALSAELSRGTFLSQLTF